MFGYDVGARIHPDEAPTGPFGGTDVPLPQIQSMIDDVFASSGGLPEIVPDVTGDGAEFGRPLDDAAELADKIHAAGGVSGGSSIEGSLNETISSPPDTEHSAMLDPVSAVFAAQIGGSMMADGARGMIWPSIEQGYRSELEYDDPSLPVATMKVGESNVGPESLEQTQYLGEHSAQLDSIPRAVGGFGVLDESNSDGGISANPLVKFQDLYTKNIADPGGDIGSSDALVLAALTDGGSTMSGEAVAERAAALDDERLLGSGYRIEHVLSSNEADVIHDPVGKEMRPTDIADFSGLEGEFYPLSRVGLPGDGIQDFAVHEISGRKSDGQLVGVGTPNADMIILPPSSSSSSGKETPGVNGMPDLSGLWGMLRDAERILPKPSFADPADDHRAAANLIETEPGDPLDLLTELVASGIADHRQKDVSSISEEKIGPAGGRSGPTGHRNDPIYTVAIGPMTGTLMPMVPTPGTSTRSPPIPGQRNLP